MIVKRAERSLKKEMMCGDTKIKNVTLKPESKSAHVAQMWGHQS